MSDFLIAHTYVDYILHILFFLVIFLLNFFIIKKLKSKKQNIKNFDYLKITSRIILFILIIFNIIFYIKIDSSWIRFASFLNIILCIDFFLITNFLYIVFLDKMEFSDKDMSKNQIISIKKSFIKYIIFLLISNLMIVAISFSFKSFPVSINFKIVLLFTILLSLSLFNFFEKYKKIKE